MCLEFDQSLVHSIKWVEYFMENEKMLGADPDLFMRGVHYVLTNAVYANEPVIFKEWFEKFKRFRSKYSSKFNENSKLLDFSYFRNAQLNDILINKNFDQFDIVEKEIKDSLVLYNVKLDSHRSIMFQYKLAMVNIYLGRYSKALDYLNSIIGNTMDILRTDIYCYSRLLHVVCHYGLNNFDLLESLIPSVKNSFISNLHMNRSLEIIFTQLRKGTKSMNFGINADLSETIKKIENLEERKYDRVPQIYFDFKLWLQSQINNVSMSELNKVVAL